MRVEESLLEKAELLNLNLSKIANVALQYEIDRRTLGYLREGTTNPYEFPGIRKTAKILTMTEKGLKFIDIIKVQIGDTVISYSEETGTLEHSFIISKEKLTTNEALAHNHRIFSYDIFIDVLPFTKIYCRRTPNSDYNWIESREILPNALTFTSSTATSRSSHPLGYRNITNVENKFIKDIYYLIEAYPHNSIIVNSVQRKLLKPDTIGASLWGFPIQGYPNKLSLK